MKFLPENKRKTRVLASIIFLCLVGIVYFNFFAGRSGYIGPAGVPAAVPGGQESQPEGFLDPLTPLTGEGAPRQSEILPYGTSFNIKILEQEKFKSLRPVPKIEVLPETLGNPNLFTR